MVVEKLLLILAPGEGQCFTSAIRSRGVGEHGDIYTSVITRGTATTRGQARLSVTSGSNKAWMDGDIIKK